MWSLWCAPTSRASDIRPLEPPGLCRTVCCVIWRRKRHCFTPQSFSHLQNSPVKSPLLFIF